MVKFLNFMLLAILMIVTVSSAENVVQPSTKPSVLFVTKWGVFIGVNDDYIEHLTKEGFVVWSIKPEELNWDQVRPFDVVVLADYYALSDETIGVLRKYVKSGGGLFTFANAAGWSCSGQDRIHVLLSPWGLEPVFEQVQDKVMTYKQKGFYKYDWAFTEKIVPHLATEGVKRVWYANHLFESGAHMGTVLPLKVSSDWTVLVKGSKNAFSRKISDVIYSESEDKPATFSPGSEPPLVAVREIGAGRVAVLGFNATSTIWGWGCPVWEGIVMTEGDGYNKSDTARLIENLYRWLGAPRKKEVGGFMAKGPIPYDVPWDWGNNEPINWTRRPFVSKSKGGLMPEAPTGNVPWGPPPEKNENFRVLIGAHSSYSNGKGTVAEWANAAKKAGYNILVFLEDFALLTPEKWERLQNECKAAGSADFAVLPGFEYCNEIGDRFFIGGPFAWPDKSLLGKDGKTIEGHQQMFFQSSALTGPLFIKSNNTRPMIYRNYEKWPLFIYENNKLKEDNRQDYIYLQANQHDLVPVVINLLYNPKEVPASGDLACTVLTQPTFDDAVKFLSANNYQKIFHQQAYVTYGPEIVDFKGFNLIRATAGQWTVSGTGRWVVRLSLHSESGLKEIKVFDGQKTAWRFFPKGKDFSVDLTGVHDRQHELVVVASDYKNREVISQVIRTRDLLRWQAMDSDRNNHDPFSIILDEKNRPKAIGQAAFHQFIKGQVIPLLPGHTTSGLENHAPGLDAADYSWWIAMEPAVHTTEGSEPGAGEVGEYTYDHVFSSVDAFVTDYEVSYKYKNDTGKFRYFGGNWPYGKSTPRAMVEGQYQVWDFFKSYNMPATVLIDIKLKAKRDLTLSADTYPNITFFGGGRDPVDERHYGHYSFCLPDDGMVSGQVLPGGAPYITPVGEMPVGGYLSLYPSPWGSGGVFALSPGMVLQGSAVPMSVRVVCGMHHPNKVWKKDEELHGQVLIVKSGKGDAVNNLLYERIRSNMIGLNGEPAYSVKCSRGKLISGLFTLDLQADNFVFAGKITKKELPVFLPVRVKGMNSNWTAVLSIPSQKEFRPVGVFENTAIAMLDISKGDVDFALGHPVTASNPDIMLTFFEMTPGKYAAAVHNPTSKPVNVKISGNMELPGVSGFTTTLMLEPGSLETIILESETHK